MTQLVNLEKRFENALEKLELALANKSDSVDSNRIKEKDKVVKEEHRNFDDLLIKIGELEKAAQSDAEEIDKLIEKLKDLLETNND